MRLQLVEPSDHPVLLELPWSQPLAAWERPDVTDLTDGLHRHVVRYLRVEGRHYVLKELPDALAEREYRLLRWLAGAGLPAVQAVGAVTERDGAAAGDGVLVTRHLDFSLPYRLLLGDRRIPYLAERLLDALAGLLVRLHLAGFAWGDCSLSNTLFRRDAGALSAYVVDVETGEAHESLSDGQRAADVLVAVENVAGGLLDLAAAGRLPAAVDPLATALAVEERYGRLWEELHEAEVFAPGETYRMQHRVRRLNALGFDVEEMEILSVAGGACLRLVPKVVELGYHAPRLAQLTGLRCGENQARRLLNDIKEEQAQLERAAGRPVPEAYAAMRWLTTVFEPVIAAIPAELAGRLEPAELYHQLLEHRWFLSEQRGRDVGTVEALASYIERVLRPAPDERTVIDGPGRGTGSVERWPSNPPT